MTPALNNPRRPLRLRLVGPQRVAVPECSHHEPGRCHEDACRYSLRPDWRKQGGLPSWAPACALEVAALGDGLTLGAVGVVLGGVTRERVRQIEAKALSKLGRRARTLRPPLDSNGMNGARRKGL